MLCVAVFCNAYAVRIRMDIPHLNGNGIPFAIFRTPRSKALSMASQELTSPIATFKASCRLWMTIVFLWIAHMQRASAADNICSYLIVHWLKSRVMIESRAYRYIDYEYCLKHERRFDNLSDDVLHLMQSC